MELVKQNVRDGIVSLKSAKEVFGVAVDPKSLEIDYDATEKLRRELKKKENTRNWIPRESNASTWLEENMKEGEDLVPLERDH